MRVRSSKYSEIGTLATPYLSVLLVALSIASPASGQVKPVPGGTSFRLPNGRELVERGDTVVVLTPRSAEAGSGMHRVDTIIVRVHGDSVYRLKPLPVRLMTPVLAAETKRFFAEVKAGAARLTPVPATGNP